METQTNQTNNGKRSNQIKSKGGARTRLSFELKLVPGLKHL